jgi:hypothetical protein
MRLFVAALFILLHCLLAVAATESENNRRVLKDDSKYKHWLQTKDLPYFEKVQEAAGRNTEYSRRQHQEEERERAWKQHKGRFADDDEVAEKSLKAEVAGKTKLTYLRREARKEQRLKDWEKEKLLDQEATTSGTKKLEDVTAEEVVTLFATLSLDSCENCKHSTFDYFIHLYYLISLSLVFL